MAPVGPQACLEFVVGGRSTFEDALGYEENVMVGFICP